jgi:small-conductance mechanosensitive channel
MDKIIDFFNYQITFSKEIHISVKAILVAFLAILISSFLLKLMRRIITRKLPDTDKAKFVSVFSYLKWVIYLVIFLVAMHNAGVNVTAIFAASAALLIGVGLALQTLFQDIFSGIFILIDQSVHVGDIIELEGKIGRVEEINLRTTRAVTVDNKVLIIPNHLYLTNSLYNWTENGVETREGINVGVAYGSDVKLVEELLLEAANSNASVLKKPAPKVLFTNFGESSLEFIVAFTIRNSFEVRFIQSDIRFEIDRLFRENNIKIPFPQRDIHIIHKNK